MWIALALASLLPMERLFQADLEDGTLDAYAGSGVGMEGIALAKTLAHWIATGIPLSLVAPILWIMLQGPPEERPWWSSPPCRLAGVLLLRLDRGGAGGGDAGGAAC